MVEVSLTVGKLDASLALLLTKDHHLIEFPTILLPNGVKAGSIVKISCERDWETEEQERQQFLAVQNEILSTFGKNLPKAPILRIKNVTQTSCVLEWDPLDLGTSSLKSLTLFRDGKKLGAIPQPLSNRTTKLSGLPIEKSIHFQLKLDSTAGVYTSETIEVTTHKMTDLSGIRVCLGDITPNEQFTVDDIQQALKNMGAHYPASNKMQIETTHFVTTRENKQNAEFLKANDMSIPIIRPEWLKACEKERRIVGVRDFYVKECVLPDIFAKNYWKKSDSDALIAAYQNKSTGEAHKEEVDKSQARKEEAGESEFTTDNSDIPSLAVSAPLSDVQDLETPRNTPTDVTSQKNESEETDGATRDIEYVSKASDHVNLGGHKNVESDEETKAELLDSSSGNATGIKDAETTAKEIETEEADLKSSTGPTNLIQHQESDSGEDVSEPKIEQQKEIEFDESKNSPNTQKDLVSAQAINETETKSREETSPVEVKEEPELQNIVPMPESDKNTQTIKAAKPTESTETTESTESEESTETTKQIEPTESTESTESTKQIEPTEPTVSTKQIEPTELAEKASLEEVSL